MKYLLQKLIISDDPGAEIFKIFYTNWISIKKIDSSYNGPLHYWSFYQLGDFDQLDVTIVRWELWSSWFLKDKFTEINKGGFVGATTFLGFYHSQNEDSFSNLKTNLDLFWEKRRSPQSPIVIYALDVKSVEEIDPKHIEYFQGYNAKLFTVSIDLLKKQNAKIVNHLFKSFLQMVNPAECSTLDITRNWWHVELEELRSILKADREGIKLTPRHAKKKKAAKVEELVPKDQPEYEVRKLTADDLTEEELQHVAIGPNGEIIPKEVLEEKTEEEIVELVKKGFTLPDWVVIPRHCPKCFNQNQRMIREVDDKNVILMERPRIYAKKLICGNCGNEWS